MELRIKGANQLGDLSKALKAAGDGGKGMKKELSKAIRDSTKDLRKDAKAAAIATLPKSGGVNKAVAASRMTVRIKTAGNSVGVTINASGSKVSDVKAIDDGRLRHPVFGNKSVWVVQSVPSGWFTKTMKKGAKPVRKEILRAMERVAKQIARGA